MRWGDWGKSFKYTRNNNGPSTVPWGTPDVTGLVSDELPSRTTVWSRWERKVAATHSTRCLLKNKPCTYRKKLDGLVDQFTLTPAIQIDSASKFSPLKWSTHFFLSIMVQYFFLRLSKYNFFFLRKSEWLWNGRPLTEFVYECSFHGYHKWATIIE